MRPRHGDKSGVALIIVLGLLAILLVVCVSFAISMRVERAGVGHLRHAAMARHLVNGAMATAIAALDAEVGDDAYPAWHSGEDLSSPTYSRSGGKYWSETFSSYDNVAGEHVSAHFFSSEVERYFPSGTAFKGYATRYLPPGETIGGDEVKAPEWIPVYGDTSGSAPSLLGRYAFFIMNTSDMLDISSIGHTNRWMGSDPGEIQLFEDLFPREVLNASALMDDIRDAGRYESFAEFNALADGSAITNVRSFTTFSYEPADTNKVMIGKKEGESQSAYVQRLKNNKRKIIEAFYDSGLQAGDWFGNKDCEQARWAYLGLIDFVDDDDEMETDDKVKPWERPATERMPLPSGFIANVVFECREVPIEDGEDDEGETKYIADPDNCEMRVSAEFKFPFIFPFIDEDDLADFDLEAKATLALGNEGDSKFLPLIQNAQNEDRNFLPTVTESAGSSGVEDNSVYNLKVEGEWIGDFPRAGDDLPCFLNDDEGADILIHGAAATYTTTGNGKLQHCFPANKKNYEDDDINSWMTVYLNTKSEDVEFDEDDYTEEPYGEYPSLKLKRWRTSIVVWVDILDPRYSSRTMAANASFDDPKFYRMSHASVNGEFIDPAYHYTVPTTRLKEYYGSIREYDLAGWGITQISENDFNERANDASGLYFDGHKDRNQGSPCPWGASPVASYLFTHPKTLAYLYELNTDGSRIDDQENSGTTDTPDMKWRAHVKNAPLENVGELGYLPIGIFQTIRLYDYWDAEPVTYEPKYEDIWQFNKLPCDYNPSLPAYHTVLDHFTIKEGATKGRANMNSQNKSVLASVFTDLPIVTMGDPHFRLNPDRRIIWQEAQNVADALLEERSENGSFKSVSGIGKIFCHGSEQFLNGPDKSWAAEAAAAAAGDDRDLGEFEREAIIRNSAGLFTTRGQSFIIAARGESYSPVFGKTSVEGGSVNASKTAIAQIWRDSVTNQWGRHPVVIQFFKIIDD